VTLALLLSVLAVGFILFVTPDDRPPPPDFIAA
jgi:hypothetical protein